MITPILERWLLNGTASFEVHNHAFSNFGRIPCPSGKVAIITKIIWHPFISPPFRGGVVTWNAYFNSNEYQLKIDGGKTVANYMLRNNVTFTLTDPSSPIDMDAVITAADYQKLNIQPGDPTIIDTFVVCEGDIKISILHNAGLLLTLQSLDFLSQLASEKNPPNGLNNVPVTAQVAITTFGSTMYYFPYSREWTALPNQPRGRSNYTIDIVQGDATNYAFLIPVTNQVTTQTPLASFHVVYVNKEVASKLQSTT